MLVMGITGLQPPCPSGWCLAPFLFLAWAKLVTRARGAGWQVNRRLWPLSFRAVGQDAAPTLVWELEKPGPLSFSHLLPLGGAQQLLGSAPLALVLRPPSAHAGVKMQRELRSQSICQEQQAGSPRGEAPFC